MNLVNYAMDYAKKGFYVIPIANNTKRPLCKFANKPPLSRDEILYNWNLHKDAQIALRTVNHFVVDIDNHNGINGLNSLETELKKQYPDSGYWFENTYAEKTKNGGYHVYFKKPVGTAIRQHVKILPGVDIKAHINNYTLIAPSTGYTALNNYPMKTAPMELIEWIEQASPVTYKPMNYSFKFDYINLRKSDNARSWERLANEPTNTETYLFLTHGKAPYYLDIYKNGLGMPGERNNILTSFIGYLVAINVNYDAIYKLATLANNHGSLPLPMNELNKTYFSIIRRDAEKWKN